ncbi:MAG: hypothetical protein KAH21_09235, partial [Spirochaetaceae bacterium]|nr:hypothetical protein [Spirochaetaceae bacterium]
MQVSRPPCWTEVKRHLLLLILFTGFIFSLTGQDFILPDLILERLIRPDISQPAVFSYAAEDWTAILPAFRRMYPVSAAESINAEMILPGKTPAGTIDSKIIITDIYYSSNLQSDSNLPNNYRLSTGAEVDIREGSDLFLNFNPSDKGVFGAVFFIPFPSSSPRPMSGELNWFQMDRLSADIRLGIKDDEGIVPYSLGHMSWNGGMLRPDSYFTDFHIYGIDKFGFSMDTGIEIDLDFNDTNWSLYSKIEGGGWYSYTINGGFARTVL